MKIVGIVMIVDAVVDVGVVGGCHGKNKRPHAQEPKVHHRRIGGCPHPTSAVVVVKIRPRLIPDLHHRNIPPLPHKLKTTLHMPWL